MQFGKVDNPENINFKLPSDAPQTKAILAKEKGCSMNIYVGCAKWNKTELKGFYPKGTKDELAYYAKQFNSIELNATFYGMPSIEQVIKWAEKTPEGFKFFPKITNSISHFKRLLNVKEITEQYCNAIANFEGKLGMVFLQLHDGFSPKEIEKLNSFIQQFPKGIPLAVEVRNEKWFSEATTFNTFCKLLEENSISNIIVDTAGRRDMLHMRLTSSSAFIRFVGCNVDEIDYKRLDEWVTRIKKWRQAGLENLYFFVHQNEELSSAFLSAYFIEKLNKALKTDLKIPTLAGNTTGSLFG